MVRGVIVEEWKIEELRNSWLELEMKNVGSLWGKREITMSTSSLDDFFRVPGRVVTSTNIAMSTFSEAKWQFLHKVEADLSGVPRGQRLHKFMGDGKDPIIGGGIMGGGDLLQRIKKKLRVVISIQAGSMQRLLLSSISRGTTSQFPTTENFLHVESWYRYSSCINVTTRNTFLSRGCPRSPAPGRSST